MPVISTNDDAIRDGAAGAQRSLDAAAAPSGDRAPARDVDPRLTAAVDDARGQNRRSMDRTGDGITRTRRDSAGKTAIDREGSGRINSAGGDHAPSSGGVGKALLGALGAAGAGMAGGGSGAPAAAAAPQAVQPAPAQPVQQMPALPQVPAATAGQSVPSALSNPAVAQLVAKLLTDGGGGTGTPMVGGAAGGGGAPIASSGSGAAGPSASSARNQFEQRILTYAQQLVSARIPYAWGGGHGPRPGYSQGIRDGGAADAVGDYAKTGLDCSGLARYLLYLASGHDIGPEVSEIQYQKGVPVNSADARPGDLVFSNFNANGPGHVMVYVGGGKAIEAQRSGTDVMLSDVRGSHFRRYFSG